MPSSLADFAERNYWQLLEIHSNNNSETQVHAAVEQPESGFLCQTKLFKSRMPDLKAFSIVGPKGKAISKIPV